MLGCLASPVAGNFVWEYSLSPVCVQQQQQPWNTQHVACKALPQGAAFRYVHAAGVSVCLQARHDKLGGPRPTLLVVSLHADDTNRAPTFDIDLNDLYNPDGACCAGFPAPPPSYHTSHMEATAVWPWVGSVSTQLAQAATRQIGAVQTACSASRTAQGSRRHGGHLLLAAG